MRKMITHVASGHMAGACQMDQSFLSHVVSGYIWNSFFSPPIDMTDPMDVGRLMENVMPNAIQGVSVIATSEKKRDTKRKRKERRGKDCARRKASDALRVRWAR